MGSVCCGSSEKQAQQKETKPTPQTPEQEQTKPTPQTPEQELMYLMAQEVCEKRGYLDKFKETDANKDGKITLAEYLIMKK